MSNRQKRVFWPTLGLLGLTLATIGFATVRNKTRIPVFPAKSEGQSKRVAPEFKQHLRVYVHGDDLRPRIIHAWPGKAVIEIANEGNADISLKVERVVSDRRQLESTINLLSRSKKAQQDLTLVAGEYALYDEAHPNSRVKLLVEPRP
jgi:hypothetical protein